jgi:solute carrier family 10 (sodium/bile acid cotransporter), member 7
MRAFVSKNWFVLSLPLAVALAWVLPEAGASGGWLRAEIATKVGVAVIFLFQGLTLAPAAMRAGALQWRLHLVVQSFTFLLFPLLGIAADALVGRHLAPDLRLGFLYLCVLPSTISTSVVLTTMAHGNTAGAIFNAVLSNLLGVFITPIWVAWLMKAGGQVQPLGPVVVEIVLLLLLPLGVGQLVRLNASAARVADARKKALGNLSSVIILFIVFAAFCNSVKARIWAQHGFGVTLVALGGVVAIFAIAMGAVELLVRVFRLNRADRIAASFCAPQKTLASGVPMAKVIFGAHPGLGLILLPIMFYHPLQLIVCGMLAGWWARRVETTRP